jgi:hypothetical protein
MRSNMSSKLTLAAVVVLTSFIGGQLTTAMQTRGGRGAAAPRPQGPCDIYAAAGDPCVAAHSTTRALYAAYNGPLYQVLRQSDGKTLDIGVVAAATDGGGYANAAAQDAFCANTYCWIATIYDQSDKHNDLTQAPRGGFSGPAMGGFNNLPIADMAPVTVMGHKVYGVFIEPGMGLRNNDPKGTAVDDQAEGQYWVINGLHYNNGCCFDYGNAETDSRDDGNGTMETTYYGNATGWYHGNPPGPWIMTDQENNLVGCVNADRSKLCADLPNITWRFVTAMAKGEPHHWTSLGGDAQQGALKVMFDGPRIDASYDPMRKQGAILLGNGGDNSVGSQGTFYEGAMTAADTFPTDATDQLIQANVVAAKYAEARVSISNAMVPGSKDPGLQGAGLQTFSPGSSQDTIVTFMNTTGAAVTGVDLSIAVPARWTAGVRGPSSFSSVSAGSSVSATFAATSGPAAWNGDLVATARWTDSTGVKHSETAAEKVRNVSPIKINEFQIASGAPANPTNSFIELHNAGTASVEISNWTLTGHATLQPIFSAVKVPAGTRLAAGGFYVLGLSNSGLSAAVRKGDTTIHVRSTTGMTVGDSVVIDTGATTETRAIAAIGTPAANSTTLWQPLPDGPVMTIPAGSTNVPVTSVSGFVVGEKIAIGYGATYPVVARTIEKFEVATVTAIGKPGTQGRLSAAASAGSSTLKVTNVDNISVGDKIRLDIASVGHGIEWVTVTAVGTAGANGTGLTIAEKLKFDHASNMPFSDRGTGISFSPATTFVHSSNEPVQALGAGITLDRALTGDHAIDAVVRDARVTVAGYQGTPNQWFGGPAFSGNAGSLVLRDAGGLVVDSLNYGLLVDPWAAEGYQGVSGTGQGGCRAPVPGVGRGGGQGGQGGGVNRSAGRFPDGADTDSNCSDFLTQIATTMPAASAVGATNIKVGNVADFAAGQTIVVDTGADTETAVIAAVGSAGATTVGADTAAGATTITVAGVAGFTAGQSITIDTGANAETVVIASSAAGRGGGAGAAGGRGGAPTPTPATITTTAPLKLAHAAGVQVSGTGITLSAPLNRAHAVGAVVATSAATPGAPNRYLRK